MKRDEIIADAIRGSYWIQMQAQGDAYLSWEELTLERKTFWLDIARRVERRLEQHEIWIMKDATD